MSWFLLTDLKGGQVAFSSDMVEMAHPVGLSDGAGPGAQTSIQLQSGARVFVKEPFHTVFNHLRQ